KNIIVHDTKVTLADNMMQRDNMLLTSKIQNKLCMRSIFFLLGKTKSKSINPYTCLHRQDCKKIDQPECI
ncbi:hypothetical protein CH426_26055, partial [Klebsiella aerogenes]